jgi:hypothetical protein
VAARPVEAMTPPACRADRRPAILNPIRTSRINGFAPARATASRPHQEPPHALQ